MSKWIAMFAAVMLVVGGTFALSSGAAEDEKPKTIKEVMGKAHKGGGKSLLKKVLSGKGSEAETKELLALYVDLAKNKPPKGDADAWKKRTAAIVKAATALSKGDKKASKALGKATNCGACHKLHKPA